MFRLSIGLAAALTLAACSDNEAPQSVEAPAAEPAVLGGVNLDQPVRAVGTEPFWGVSIDTEAVVSSGVDQAERRGANDGVVVQGTTATWSVRPAQGQPFTVTLMATECSDGMSDRLYPLTALVEMGETRLNGCAAPAAALLQEQAAG